jgi:hypothetical protein
LELIIFSIFQKEFSSIGAPGIHAFGNPNYTLYDLKDVVTKEEVDLRL